MENMNFYIQMLLVVSILAILVSLCAIFSYGNQNYSMLHSNKVATINNDGSVSIKETIEYDIEETYNGLTFKIPINNNQSITNVSVVTSGIYSEVSDSHDAVTHMINVKLYSDQEKSQYHITNQSLNVTYYYTINKEVNLYNDIAELDDIVWNSGWQESIDSVDFELHIPAENSEIEVWNNPPFYNTSMYWSDSHTLKIHYDKIGEYENVTLRMLLPTEYFTSYDNVQLIDMDAKADIESTQIEYQKNIDNNNYFSYILIGLSLLLMLTPIAVIISFRLRPKSMLDEKYVTKPPRVPFPAVLNILATGDRDEVNMNALFTTLLDLLNRGYLKVVSDTKEDTVLKVTNIDKSNLYKFEIDILDFFEKYGNSDNTVSFKKLRKDSLLTVGRFINNWYIQLYDDYSNSVDTDKYYKFAHNILLETFPIITIIFIIISELLLHWIFTIDVPIHSIVNRFLLLLFIEAVIVLFLPKKLKRQWTQKGCEFKDRCKLFRNYVENYEYICENPPESTRQWTTILVYATALGRSKSMKKNISKYFKEKYIESKENPDKISDIKVPHYLAYGSLYQMYNMFRKARLFKGHNFDFDFDFDYEYDPIAEFSDEFCDEEFYEDEHNIFDYYGL